MGATRLTETVLKDTKQTTAETCSNVHAAPRHLSQTQFHQLPTTSRCQKLLFRPLLLELFQYNHFKPSQDDELFLEMKTPLLHGLRNPQCSIDRSAIQLLSSSEQIDCQSRKNGTFYLWQAFVSALNPEADCRVDRKTKHKTKMVNSKRVSMICYDDFAKTNCLSYLCCWLSREEHIESNEDRINYSGG
jgi:hypothetical protein